MEDEKIREFILKAKKIATRMGFGEHADDIAQEAFISQWTGRASKVEHSAIDFVRGHYGRSGSPCGDAKQRARMSGLCLHKIGESESGTDVSLYLDGSDDGSGTCRGRLRSHRDVDADRLWSTLKESLSRQENLVAEWKVVFGCSGREIADRIGVSESRVSQIWLMAREKIEGILAESGWSAFVRKNRRSTKMAMLDVAKTCFKGGKELTFESTMGDGRHCFSWKAKSKHGENTRFLVVDKDGKNDKGKLSVTNTLGGLFGPTWNEGDKAIVVFGMGKDSIKALPGTIISKSTKSYEVLVLPEYRENAKNTVIALKRQLYSMEDFMSFKQKTLSSIGRITEQTF